MLGNVVPFKGQLSEENANKYQSMYCGLCKCLQKRYGVLSRFALNYDMVFIAIIYNSLHDEEEIVNSEGCFANPFKKKPVCKANGGLNFAADMLVLLTYYKILDNIRDDSFFKKLGNMALLPFVYFKYKKAKRLWGDIDLTLKNENRRQQLLEEGQSSLDELCMPTCNMTKAILTACCEEKSVQISLARFGFFLGRVIYLLDALKDRKEDEKENKFNIFNLNKLSVQAAKEECFMSLGELSLWYRQLCIDNNNEILDNIIYLGLARSIEFADAVPKMEEK